MPKPKRAPNTEDSIHYFAELRQEWIFEALRTYGFIGYRHLMRKFGISQFRAANDLITFIKLNPDIDLARDHASGVYHLNAVSINKDPLIRGKAVNTHAPKDGHTGRIKIEAVARESARAATADRAKRRQRLRATLGDAAQEAHAARSAARKKDTKKAGDP